jgi:malonyl-CoA/methylmalonyl-CoA synthetase
LTTIPSPPASVSASHQAVVSATSASLPRSILVRIVGREKDLVITGGLNVYPAEVEAAIEAIPGVAECAVIGVPHPDFGEGVVAVAIARPGAVLDEAAIDAALAGTLAAYKGPKRIFLAESLPRNAMGKVQKNSLRESFAATFA